MTPSRTLIVREKKKYICNVCEIELYDNSTLHKHMKRKHVNITKVMVENKKENIINQLLVQKKKVSWSEDINKVIEIPYTKASVKGQEYSILKMFSSVECLMTVCTNRKQQVNTNKLINAVQRQTKQTFDIHIFCILVSLDMYNVKLLKGDLIVTVNEIIMSPSVVSQRQEYRKNKSTECAKFLYIDLVSFPEQDIKPYQPAKEIIEENIFKFEYNENELDEDNCKLTELKNMNTNITKKVKLNIKLKKAREENLKK